MCKKVVALCIVVICLIMLVYFSIPAFAILGEFLLVRWEIQNPYVNNGYRGWTSVQIEDCNSFLVPDGWIIEEDAEIYWIIDESGETWAFGAVLGTEESSFVSYKDLITAANNSPCTAVEFAPFNGFVMMNGSDIDRLQIYSDDARQELFSIQMLESAEKDIVWILTKNISLDESQYDIAEAIVYSYAFPGRRERQNIASSHWVSANSHCILLGRCGHRPLQMCSE